MAFDDIENKAEGRVIAYLDAHAQIARKVAWGFVIAQVLLALGIMFGSISSVIAAAVCLLTAVVLLWLLVKTRPVAPVIPS